MKNNKLHLGVLLLVCLMAIPYLKLSAQPSGLVLWNKLGSADEVSNSEVGPDLVSYSHSEFVPGPFPSFGHALTLRNGVYGRQSNVEMINLSGSLNMEKGTVECWYKQNQDPVPYVCGVFRIFDGPWGKDDNHSSVMLFSYHDIGAPPARLYFCMNDPGTPYVPAISVDDGIAGLDISSLNGNWIHLSAVWDRSGINGSSETMRLYVDGVKKAVSTESDWGTSVGPDADIGGSTDGDTYDKFFIDNLKIWNYAKTDFSDRFTEGLIDPPEITCPADVFIDCNETDPSVTGIATAVNHCTGVLNINYTDVEVPGACLHKKVITRTWTASDECGNTSNCEQIITVEDIIAPVITNVLTLELENDPGTCGAIVYYPVISATDNCTADVTPSVDPPTGTFFPVGSSTVTLSAIDECGNTDNTTFEVVVANQIPDILSVIAPLDPIQIETEVIVSATFNDNNLASATWDWGDPHGMDPITDGTINGNSITGVYQYSTPGVYTLTLIITDKCGETDTEVYEYVVVYEPDGGFVVGGGWIDSPPGAYKPDPSLRGKAIFGFVSKYKKGKTVPERKPNFKLIAGPLNFKSKTYDWQVTAGSKTMYKGKGTINGSGDYGVLLSATDGDHKQNVKKPDRFRIKIWDKLAGDAIVYDNKIDAGASTVLKGGSISIRPGKKVRKINLKSADVIEHAPKINIYPNPFDNLIYVDLITESTHEIIIDMIDINGRVIEYLYAGVIAAEVDHSFEFNTKADLTPGTYMLRIRAENGELLRREIIIRR